MHRLVIDFQIAWYLPQYYEFSQRLRHLKVKASILTLFLRHFIFMSRVLLPFSTKLGFYSFNLATFLLTLSVNKSTFSIKHDVLSCVTT